MNKSLERSRQIILCGAMSIFLVTWSVGNTFGEASQSTNKKYYVTKTTEEKSFNESETLEPTTEETKSSSGSTNLLIAGGAAAIGIAAIAIGAGGGGSSDESSESSSSEVSSDTTSCGVADVGPHIAGNWSGRLRLINIGSQNVNATITQCGRKITITTTSTLRYGKSFSGSTSSNGDIHVADNTTFQIWTSHKGRASSHSLRIYDYVNNQTALDSLELAR